MFLLTNQGASPILGQPGTAVPAAPVAEGAAVAVAPVAAAPADAGGFNMWWMYGIWGVVIVGFYFLTIRPQRKRDKETREMQSALKVGDNVVTSAGMYGRIAEVGEDCFLIEFGTNRGIRIPISKTNVLGLKTPQITPSLPDKED